jgi:hypothetical protein
MKRRRDDRSDLVRRILFVTQSCYLDDSSGAAVATRMAAEALARRGFAVEALTGTMLDLDVDVDPAEWLAGRGIAFEPSDGGAWTLDARGLRADVPRHYRMGFHGIPLTLHHSPTSRLHEPDQAERDEFLRLYAAVLERFRPDVLVNLGGDVMAHEVRARARAQGATVVFALHNLNDSLRSRSRVEGDKRTEKEPRFNTGHASVGSNGMGATTAPGWR